MKSRLTLLIIATMFLLPLVAAWMMSAGMFNLGPQSTVNHGSLVQPPVTVEWSEEYQSLFLGHWSIVYKIPTPCLSACTESVIGLRQMHTATGRHQDRVRIVLWLSERSDELSHQLLELDPKANILVSEKATRSMGTSLEQLIRPVVLDGTLSGSGFMIDPLGNIMMHYSANTDAQKIKQDLKRLLTYSKLDG